MATEATAFVACAWEHEDGSFPDSSLLEVAHLGFCLRQHDAPIRRVVLVTPKLFRKKKVWRWLGDIWEIHQVQHLQVKHKGCGHRLAQVWTKLRVFDPASYAATTLPSVILFLDTDIHVRASLSDLFWVVHHDCRLAAVWRGGCAPNTAIPGEVRPSHSIRKCNPRRPWHGGGINSGVFVARNETRLSAE